MSIFILDPQGEFSTDYKPDSETRKTVEKNGRRVDVIPVHDITLTGWDLFNKILVTSRYIKRLGVILEANQYQAATQIEQILKNLDKTKEKALQNSYLPDRFEAVWSGLQDPQVLSHIYSSPDLRQRVLSSIERADPEKKLEQGQGITKLFAPKPKSLTIPRLADRIQRKNMLTVIDLSGKQSTGNLYWNDEMKYITIGRILEALGRKAQQAYNNEKPLNSLVVIDEAHRLAPRQAFDNPDLEAVRTYLIDAVRTTRKYGLGWMFISQTLSSLHSELINQIRIHMFGFGLSWGVERDALRELIGGQKDSLSLYQRFRDPQSSLKQRNYSFMSIGPVSPLSFSGTPLFFNAYRYPDEFYTQNNKKSL
jgi:hypothetical protein